MTIIKNFKSVQFVILNYPGTKYGLIIGVPFTIAVLASVTPVNRIHTSHSSVLIFSFGLSYGLIEEVSILSLHSPNNKKCTKTHLFVLKATFSFNTMTDHKYLVIGPAAMGYFAFLGALSNIDTNKFEEISGSSAGAIIGLCLACGKTVDEITQWSLNLDLKELSKMNLKSFLISYGLISHEPIKKKFVDFIGNPTFSELKKKLYVSSFCVNTAKTEYFSVDTHPDMFVVDAVCMSMSVPFLFESVKLGGLLYVDGGTIERLPLEAFANKKEEEILCIKMEIDPPKFEVKDLKQFVSNLVLSTLDSKYQGSRGKIIKIQLGSVNVFDFLMTLEQKLKLFLIGQNLKEVE